MELMEVFGRSTNASLVVISGPVEGCAASDCQLPVESRQHVVALRTFGAVIATRTDMTGPVMTPD